MERKVYLGDSVYCEFLSPHEIILTTDNGMGASNTIILDVGILKSLNVFVERNFKL